MTDQWKYKRKEQNDIDHYFRGLRSFVDELLDGINDINSYSKRLQEIATDPQFDQLANEAARKIVTYQANSNARTWREAMKKSSKGYKLYKSLSKELRSLDEFNNLIAEGAYQIKTLPLNISQRIVKRIARLSIEGKRTDTIATDIKKYFPEATKASAQLIARTQIAKTYAAITESRAKKIGIQAYVWHTVGGPRVRDSHRHMNDVIVFYNEPPAPEELIGKKSAGHYHAGGIYNCRCYEEPLLDIVDVTWPHKVYHAGKITKMSRKRFTDLLS